MPLSSTVHFLSCLLLSVGVYLCAWAGLVINDESSSLLRYLVAGCLMSGTLLAAVRSFFDDRLRQIRLILAGGGVMLGLQLLALTIGAPGGRIDAGILAVYMLQQTTLVGWIVFCFGCDWKSRGLWLWLILVGYGVLLANTIAWFLEGTPIPFAGLGTGKNGLAAAAAMAMFWGVAGCGLLAKPRERFMAAGLVLLGVFVLFFSGGRASMLLVAFAACAYPILNWVRGRPLAQWVALAAIIAFEASVPYMYVELDRFAMFQTVDDWLQRYTHSIHSGRESLWPEVMAGIRAHPIAGNGTAESWRFTRKHFGVETELSAHNLWLAILFQSGFVGLAGLLCFLWTVWHCLLNRSSSFLLRLSTAAFVGTLLRETFEVSLVQNTLQIGIGSWAAIMAGLGWRTSSVASSRARANTPTS